MDNFSVKYRNYGHWDIWTKTEDFEGRIFCIRGGPGKYYVRDERDMRCRYYTDGDGAKYFKTVQACMAYITDILMYELIVADGQKPTTIASWNV